MERDSFHLPIHKRTGNRRRALSVPVQPLLNFDTCVKELNDAIVRAEFRNLTTESRKNTGGVVTELVNKNEEISDGLNDADDEPLSVNPKTIKEILEENERLKKQLDQILKS